MATTNVTQEIPKSGWRAYFDMIADQYAGWATTIELLSPELGDQPRVNGLPLQGISYEYKGGSQACDILVEVGELHAPFETHLIHRPRIVRVVTTQPGAETDIEFESEEGYITLVRLRPRPALPDNRERREQR
jgi:hypothetical protein